MNDLRAALTDATSEIVERIVALLPSLLGALLLIVAGWLLARLLRALTVRAVLLENAAAGH